MAGVLIWNYTPTPTGTDCGYCVRPGDPTLSTVDNYTAPAPVPAPAASGRLIARHSGGCLDVTGAATVNGALVEQNTCGPGDDERFAFRATDGGFYELVNVHSGRCVDVVKQSIQLKAPIDQWDCWGGGNQQFRLQATDSGDYRLIGRNSVMCLDVVGQSTAVGAGLQQYDCTAGANQQFRIGQRLRRPRHRRSCGGCGLAGAGVVMAALGSRGPG